MKLTSSFHQTLHDQLVGLNIKKYAFLFFDRCHFIAPDIYSTYSQEWLIIYQEQQLYYHDPIINFARSTIKPFSWNSIIPLLPSKDQEYLKKIKRYGITDGYTLTTYDALGNVAFLSVLSDSDAAIDISFYEENRAKLQMLLVDLCDLYLQEKKHIEYYRDKVYLFLSSREKLILKLGYNGLTYKEIASELELSERTIKFHMNKIFSKLSVKNATQAFIKCKKLCII